MKLFNSDGKSTGLLIVASAVISIICVALLISIFQRKQEAKNPFFKVAELTDETDDPKIWAQNFPHQYEGFIKTVDQVRTRYGGSEAIPRTPSDADPRSVVSQSKLEEDPRLVTMWAGYGFSKDFREERGHAHMFVDQLNTGRQSAKLPGTCINCHASTYVPFKKVGGGDLFEGFAKINQMKYSEAKTHFNQPIACIDCHDPKTMKLRVTKPAFIEGIKAFKQHEGIPNYDVNTMASRQEMRTFVCGQCHVEYYFKGDEKRLTFPWSKGLRADEIYSYYEDINFKDWTHKLTGAPALKAQHPEFEMWNQGIHAKSGVSCTDCHMPYKKVGAMKITDHHVQSPVLSIRRSCQTCHKVSESELKARVENIQSTNFEVRNLAMDALMDLIKDLESKGEEFKKTEKYKQAQKYQRKAQFFLDFVEAENSTGFHAPQEAARVLGISIDSSRKGQKLLSE